MKHLRWVSELVSDGSKIRSLSGRSAVLGDSWSRNPVNRDELLEQRTKDLSGMIGQARGFDLDEFLSDWEQRDGTPLPWTLPSDAQPTPPAKAGGEKDRVVTPASRATSLLAREAGVTTDAQPTPPAKAGGEKDRVALPPASCASKDVARAFYATVLAVEVKRALKEMPPEPLAGLAPGWHEDAEGRPVQVAAYAWAFRTPTPTYPDTWSYRSTWAKLDGVLDCQACGAWVDLAPGGPPRGPVREAPRPGGPCGVTGPWRG